jgi:hypothetical protein
MRTSFRRILVIALFSGGFGPLSHVQIVGPIGAGVGATVSAMVGGAVGPAAVGVAGPVGPVGSIGGVATSVSGVAQASIAAGSNAALQGQDPHNVLPRREGELEGIAEMAAGNTTDSINASVAGAAEAASDDARSAAVPGAGMEVGVAGNASGAASFDVSNESRTQAQAGVPSELQASAGFGGNIAAQSRADAGLQLANPIGADFELVGRPVVSAEGTGFGTVQSVQQDAQNNVLNEITVRTNLASQGEAQLIAFEASQVAMETNAAGQATGRLIAPDTTLADLQAMITSNAAIRASSFATNQQ